MRTPMKLDVTAADRLTLEQWLKSRAVTSKVKRREQIVLMTAEGRPTEALMRVLKVSHPTMNLWRRRYAEGGMAALRKGKTLPPGTPL